MENFVHNNAFFGMFFFFLKNSYYFSIFGELGKNKKKLLKNRHPIQARHSRSQKIVTNFRPSP